MKVVVSRCLLGDACRFDGGSKPCQAVREVVARVEAVPVCPECAGGLPIPRPPSEISGDRVVSASGTDVTAAFEAGAEACVKTALASGARLAILKAKSPSCGVGAVYDGTFTSTLRVGDGVFASRLIKEGFVVVTEQDIQRLHPTVEHPVALMLGSGMAHLADLVHPVRRIPYDHIPDFPSAVHPVPGHRFEVTIGTLADVPVVVYPGRAHLYQGANASQVTALVRHAHHLGCRSMIVVAASGALPGTDPGLALITDHINLTGANPLTFADDLKAARTPFISLKNAYTPYLAQLARQAAADRNIPLGEGVYAGVTGPSFETPAECRALATIGASFVGFSVVLETIMAAALGMDVLGLTVSANTAGEAGVSHNTVLAFAKDNGHALETLVTSVLTAM